MSFAITSTFAASSGGGSSGGTPASPVSPKKLKCKKSQVAKKVTDEKTGKKIWICRKAVVGILPDSEMFAQGKLLALEGEYDWALDVLTAVQDQQDPDVLNMQGYSHRKAGRLDVAITYYSKALAINPDFVRAREYLGEGYVAAGRVDLALAELSQIKDRCGVSCEEYIELSRIIAEAQN